jgi:hypothetical protein
MKIVKTAFQNQEGGHETAYIITGIFRKKYYRIDVTGVVQIPVYELKEKK